jgi:hypothetical protein
LYEQYYKAEHDVLTDLTKKRVPFNRVIRRGKWNVVVTSMMTDPNKMDIELMKGVELEG